jgi:hypothetical protein
MNSVVRSLAMIRALIAASVGGSSRASRASESVEGRGEAGGELAAGAAVAAGG